MTQGETIKQFIARIDKELNEFETELPCLILRVLK